MALPVWLVVRLPKRQLGIQCPRKKCMKKAVVTRDWLHHETHDTRACTYCFQASRIPKELT